MDEAGGIGKGGRLPWHLRSDLQRFKALTMGHHLILGRRTWESIGRPLPGRTVIILSRQPGYFPAGCATCRVCRSFEQALKLARTAGETEVFIGGGSKVFAQALPYADRLYLTRVQVNADCEVFFPPLDWDEWQEIERQEHPADAHNDYPHTFHLLTRRKPLP